MSEGIVLAEKFFAGIACSLSIIGAFLVIFSFICNAETSFDWKELYYKLCCGYGIREKNSQGALVSKYKLKSYNTILINLSVADILVAASHLWGMSIIESDNSCVIQAAVTIMSTASSFVWTEILVVFLAVNMVFAGCSNNFLTNVNNLRTHETRLVVPKKAEAPHCCESPFFLWLLFPSIGWVIPVMMTIGFANHDMLGYPEHENSSASKN